MLCLFWLIFLRRPFEIFLPFQRQHTLLQIIAFLAAGNEIILGRTSASCKGNQVIHGNIPEGDLLPAVVAESGGGFLLPPSCLA